MDTVIKIINVTRSFGNSKGIFNFSLEIKQGQIVGIIGPNGSGKSTIMNCINFFDPIDSGSIYIMDELWIDYNADKKYIRSNTEIDNLRRTVLSYLSQDSLPWPHLSVIDNILKVLIHGMSVNRNEAEEIALKALEKFGILDRVKSKPYQLSGGLRQRVELAKFFSLTPKKILCLDEATSALDPEWTEKVRCYIREFSNAGGAVLISSHRLGFVRRIADKIIFLNQGRIIEQGNNSEILDNPQNEILKKFIQNA